MGGGRGARSEERGGGCRRGNQFGGKWKGALDVSWSWEVWGLKWKLTRLYVEEKPPAYSHPRLQYKYYTQMYILGGHRGCVALALRICAFATLPIKLLIYSVLNCQTGTGLLWFSLTWIAFNHKLRQIKMSGGGLLQSLLDSNFKVHSIIILQHRVVQWNACCVFSCAAQETILVVAGVDDEFGSLTAWERRSCSVVWCYDSGYFCFFYQTAAVLYMNSHHTTMNVDRILHCRDLLMSGTAVRGVQCGK